MAHPEYVSFKTSIELEVVHKNRYNSINFKHNVKLGQNFLVPENKGMTIRESFVMETREGADLMVANLFLGVINVIFVLLKN